MSVPNPFDPRLSADILKDYKLELKVRVESTLRDLRGCLKEAIKYRDCCNEAFDAIMENFDEIVRTYQAELATLQVELTQRG